MDIESIQELIALMEEKRIKKIHIKKKDGEEIELERAGFEAPAQIMHAAPAHQAAPPPYQAELAPAAPEEAAGKAITSLMVGTFYASPSPDDPVFVKVGDTVTPDTVVCIIEAMKVMNEVKAGIAGTVTEVCTAEAQPVEFGTPLFRII